MGWEDRDYYRDRSTGPSNPIMWLLGGSAPLFTIFDIRVRIHSTLIILAAVVLLFPGATVGMTALDAVVWITFLFISVLLHEFGHCFSCRWVGGHANNILMWPLGGLAYTEPPRRWWPSFITTAGGPAVNVALCVISSLALVILGHGNNFSVAWSFSFFHPFLRYEWVGDLDFYIWYFFRVNYSLFMFNMMLAFYPFDAGRMIQEILWAFIGYYKSMRFAAIEGMVVAAFVGMIGLATSWLLFSIALMGFMECYRQHLALKEAGPYGFEDDIYSAAAMNPPRERKTSRRAERSLQRKMQEAQAERRRIDTILQKVSAQGMNSLNWWEKRTLRKATERQRRTHS